MNMNCKEYLSQSQEERQCFLELCAYQNLLVRVRSERVLGGAVHIANKSEKAGHLNGMNRLKEKSLEERMRFTSDRI